MSREVSLRHYQFKIVLITLTQILILLYLSARVFFFFVYPLPWLYTIIALIFFMAECFVLFHAWDYFGKIKTVCQAFKKGLRLEPEIPPLRTYPPVAIVVASYKEPLNIIEDTLVCFHNLTYPNKHLYLLDDTRYDQPWDTPENIAAYKLAVERLCEYTEVNLFRRRWHHAKAGITNDFLEYSRGSQNPDFKMVEYSKSPRIEPEKYLIVFDADQNPFPDFVEPLVSLLEANPDVAFIQTPQYYTNFMSNKIARAASLMQVVFYEWICESKGTNDLMMLCGTNVILRTEVLKEVGDFDVSSVTEDFATGYRMHKKGWKSWYMSKPTAFGMGPEDLGSFFKQQHRWAMGTTGMFVPVLKDLLFSKIKRPFVFWWEYLSSSSYYFIGWAYLVFIFAPASYLFFNVPIYMFPTSIYFALIFPYNVFAEYLYFSTLRQRGYTFKDLFSGMVVGILCMPINMQASFSGLLGIKGKFVVTAKGEINSLPFWDLWPQILMALVSFICLVWGGLRLYYEGEPVGGLLINMFWVSYYFFIYSAVFWYNSPEEATDAAALEPMTART